MDTTPSWMASFSMQAFPRLDRDIDVDVAVIGGGVVGITAAHLLKQAGKTVALLERSRCASVDTGHTTAHLTCVPDVGLRELCRVFGRGEARATWDAGAAAIDRIVSLIRQLGIPCDFQWVPGYLHAAPGEESQDVTEQLRQEAEIANELEIQARVLPKVPFFGTVGVEFPHQALFHPLKYLSFLIRQIPGDGCHVFENTEVEAFGQGDLLTLKAAGREVRCRYVVVATHSPVTGARPMINAMLFQTKLSLKTSYALSARIPVGQIPHALFWDTHDPYRYLRVEPGRDGDVAIFGGEDHKTGQESDTAKRFGALRKRFLQYVPSAEIEHQWSGQVIETPDGLPYMGMADEREFFATGFAGNGMTFGTLAAMMAVDAIEGRKNPWSELFSLSRSKVLGATWRYLKDNKDYPYYLLRDRFSGAEAGLESVGPGQGAIVNVGGKKVAAFRAEDGRLALCSPVCTHLQCVVHWNNAEHTWDCPCHGSRFRPTGEVISGPAEEPLKRLQDLERESDASGVRVSGAS